MHQPTSIYQLLAYVKERPAMYLGNKALSPLWHFLKGYTFGLAAASLKAEDVPDFGLFSSWVRGRVNTEYDLSAGWLHHILSACENNEENAFDLFFVLVEEYKTVKPIAEIQYITNSQKIFHDHGHGSFWENTAAIALLRLAPGKTYWTILLDNEGNALANSTEQTRAESLARIRFNFAINNNWQKMDSEASQALLEKME